MRPPRSFLPALCAAFLLASLGVVSGCDLLISDTIIRGIVVNAQTGQPIEDIVVSIYNFERRSLVGGDLTNAAGRFEINVHLETGSLTLWVNQRPESSALINESHSGFSGSAVGRRTFRVELEPRNP